MSLRQIILVICFLFTVSGWECGGARDEIMHGPVHERHLMTRSSNLSAIRLSPYYLNFTLGTTAQTDYFKNTLYPYVDNFFKTTLKVYSVQQSLIVGSKCLGFGTPKDHQTKGVANADVLIYIKSENNTANNYVAYAGACNLDATSKNNVYAGLVMINSYYFNQAKFSSQYSILIHEIYHLLGFSSNLYKYWKDENGLAYSAPTEAVTIRGLRKMILKTPNVVAKAKVAFNCSNLTGVELEEYGSSGTASSHWDMRIMYNDFMIGRYPQDPIFSTISLALMKDTGWYEVDYSKAETPYFGRGLGCSFFDNKCVSGGVSNFPSLFCDQPLSDTCDTFYLWKSYCTMYSFTTTLPSAYQYFTNPKYGGDNYADFCPVRLGYSNGNCRAVNFNETYTYSDGYESIGPNSHCFISTLSNKYSYSSGTRCYEVTSCSATEATIKIGSTTFTCPFTGGSFSVPGFYGKVTCPASKVLCENIPCIDACRGYGVCQNGTCVCDPGYSGSSCQYICGTNCSVCTQTNCTVCKDPNAVANGLNCSCKTGYLLSTSGICTSMLPCDVLCKTCNNGVCSNCTSNSSLVNGKCSCSNGFTINGTSCISCGFSCTSCSTSACLTCAAGSVLSSGSCVCSAGYFKSNTSCIACPTNCDVCTNSTNCTTCKSGYFVTSTRSCQNCSANCMQCNSTKCISCVAGFFLNNGTCSFPCDANCKNCSSGVCSLCNPGFYPTSTNCTACINKCSVCSNSTKCISCVTGYNVISNGTCGILCSANCTTCDFNTGKCSLCANGYYPETNGTCVICPIGCTACTLSTQCTSCSAGYLLTNGVCKIQCPANCATCSSSTLCTTCNSGYSLTSTASCNVTCPSNCTACNSLGSCTTCSSGFFVSSGKCSACIIGCSNCSSSTACTTCNAGYYLSSTQSCTLCTDKNCSVCTSTSCTTCKAGFTIKNGVCA